MSKNSKTVVAKSATKKAETVKAPKSTAKKVEAKASATKKTAPKAKADSSKSATAKASAVKTVTKATAKPAKSPAPKKVAVAFEADCPLATTVSVAGSFNDWAVDVDMLKKNKKTGLWTTKISLLPGDYEYKFVCDGKNWDEGENKTKHV